jgi:hypothetical protein
MGPIHMEAIPIAILQVKNLKYLVISSLRCEALPEAISDIWSLQALHVTFSDLLELPKSIGKMQELRKLNLFCCRELKCLPDSIGDCQMISSIDLSYCKKLRVLPVLDGLEPPPGIKKLKINRYSGRECARWMQNQAGGGVQGLPYLPFLKVMKLYDFPNLKHLDGQLRIGCGYSRVS